MLRFVPSIPHQFLEHSPHVVRQPALERHPAPIAGMRERQTRGVQEGATEMRHRAQVARHAPVYAAVQGIADYGMADGAQMHSNLVGASGVDGDADERQRPSEMLSA